MDMSECIPRNINNVNSRPLRPPACHRGLRTEARHPAAVSALAPAAAAAASSMTRRASRSSARPIGRSSTSRIRTHTWASASRTAKRPASASVPRRRIRTHASASACYAARKHALCRRREAQSSSVSGVASSGNTQAIVTEQSSTNVISANGLPRSSREPRGRQVRASAESP